MPPLFCLALTARGKLKLNHVHGRLTPVDERERRILEALRDKITELSINMEKMKLAEYVQLLEQPGRLLYVNFLSGLARGVGVAVGFALLGAILIMILQRLVMLNLPVIGGFIAEIVAIVQSRLGSPP
jgi:hypothetical protein